MCCTCCVCNTKSECYRKRDCRSVLSGDNICEDCYWDRTYAKHLLAESLGLNGRCKHCDDYLPLHIPIEQFECPTCLNRFRKTKRAS